MVNVRLQLGESHTPCNLRTPHTLFPFDSNLLPTDCKKERAWSSSLASLGNLRIEGKEQFFALHIHNVATTTALDMGIAVLGVSNYKTSISAEQDTH